MMRKAAVVGILLVASGAGFAGEEKFKLKPGSGAEQVQANCSACHSLDYIQLNSPFLDRKGWEAEVTKMMKAFGAPVKPEDVPAITGYLAREYGKP